MKPTAAPDAIAENAAGDVTDARNCVRREATEEGLASERDADIQPVVQQAAAVDGNRNVVDIEKAQCPCVGHLIGGQRDAIDD